MISIADEHGVDNISYSSTEVTPVFLVSLQTVYKIKIS